MSTIRAWPPQAASLAASLLLALAAGFAAPATARTVDLDAEPPDLSVAVAPNVLMSFDDSGSMMRAYMPDEVGGKSRLESTTTGAGTIHSKDYYFSGVNTIYFNPDETYLPPLLPDGLTRFPDSPYTNAWRDGICANLPADGTLGPRCTITRVNLSNSFYKGFDSFLSTDDILGYSHLSGTRDIPTAVRMSGTATVNGGFYYIRNSAGTLELKEVTTAQQQNFANWYSYYRTRSLMARSGVGSAFATLDGSIRVAWQNLTNSPITDATTISAFAGTRRNDFFKWLFTIPTGLIGGTPNRLALDRGGKFFSSGYTGGKLRASTNPYWEPVTGAPNGGYELSCRQNFHMLVTDGIWNGGAPTAVDANRLVSSTFTLPDGKAYAPTINTNGNYTRVFRADAGASAGGTTLAQQAFEYWNQDLRSDLTNNVPPNIADSRIGITNTASRPTPINPLDDPEIYYNPANDPATWQHVVQHMVTMGVSGELPASNATELANTLKELRIGPRNWPVVAASDSPTRIDDTWHAAVNGRGSYFTARKPQELTDGIRNVLNNVASNRQGGAAVTATSSVLLTADGEGFGTEYTSSGWTGRLYKRRVGEQGQVDLTSALWEAGQRINDQGQANRRLFTSDTNNRRNGLPFVYASLSTQQRAVLDLNPTVSTLSNQTFRENPQNWQADNLGAQRVAYLRGDRSAENAAPNFRTRLSLLGAIIESQPLYISSPGALGDTRESYEDFVYDNRARRPMVYIGSNDGMLHAFNAGTGAEEWAFVPGTLIENGRMTRMTMASARLVPGADDTPIASDVMIDGNWKTVLVGSLRLGGRGVYALDVTSPVAASEAGAAGKLMWEFNSNSPNAANLGYTYASANILRLNTEGGDDRWAVAVASGYFPEDGLDSNAPAASVGQTSLFILDIKDGSIIRELRTPANVVSFGLSTPAAFDSDASGTTDVVMTGDLAGNLWRFDLSSPNPAEWSVRQFFTTYTTAADIGKQPISVMPVAFADRNEPIWVFGTGKYLGDTDRSATIAVQSFYGVRDSSTASVTYPLNPSQLTAQTIADSGTSRTITRNAVQAQHYGWKMALDKRAGERNVSTLSPLYVSNIAVLLTLVPGGGDPCSSTRSGVVMVVDAANGGALADATFSGRLISNPPPRLPVSVPVGGGPLVIPGISGGGGSGGGTQLCPTPPCPDSLPMIPGPYWHRAGWRELLDDFQR